MTASTVTVAGNPLPSHRGMDELQKDGTPGWANGHDRFGAVTWVRIAAGQAQAVQLSAR
jgi:hypothetical protein